MSVTRQLLEDYKKNKDDQLYQAVMEIIVKANENRLKEGKRDMSFKVSVKLYNQRFFSGDNRFVTRI